MSFVKPSESPVTPRQWVFIELYMKDPNATKAAREAGYKHPNVAGPQLLNPKKYPLVVAEIEQRRKELARKAGVELVDLVRGLAQIANFNIQDIVDSEGRFLPLHQIPREIAACIQEAEVRISSGRSQGEDGDEESGGTRQAVARTTRIKSYSKLEAYKQIAMLLGWMEKKREEEERVVNNTVNNTVNNVTIDWASIAAGAETNQFTGQKMISSKTLALPTASSSPEDEPSAPAKDEE